MKITDVEAIVLESPNEYGIPVGGQESQGVKYCLLLKVSTDEGITGWSDVETAPHVAAAVVGAPATGRKMFEGLRSLVVGEDPFDVERLWDKVYRGTAYYGRRGVAIQVLSGFDIACHDIIGKAIGRPLHKVLGGAYRDRVRAYASTLFRSTPDDMKRACDVYLRRGFTAIKFGWGVFGQDRKRDVALVAAAREAIGPDVELLVDAGWSVNRSPYDAIELLRQLEPYRDLLVGGLSAPGMLRRLRPRERGRSEDAAGRRRTGGHGLGFPSTDPPGQGGRDPAGSEPLRRAQPGPQDHLGGRTRRRRRLSPCLVDRSVVGRQSARECLPPAEPVPGVQRERKPDVAGDHPQSRRHGRPRNDARAARTGPGDRRSTKRPWRSSA